MPDQQNFASAGSGVCVCVCMCSGSLVSHTPLHCISECVQLVMGDAKKRKSEWEQQLPMVKLTNLLQLRDALMVTACIHMMRLEVGDECMNAQLSHMTVR